MSSRAIASSKLSDETTTRVAPGQDEDDRLRDSIMEAMLVASGELGYREVSIDDVLARCGAHRVQFYKRFANKEACFAAAYATWADRLATELLAAALAAGDWRRGMRSALVSLIGFAEAGAALTRALLVEAEVAGGVALEKHEETIERLGEAIDSAREQVPPEERPPALTGIFVAGGIATYVSEQLTAGEPASMRRGLPELMRFATAPYFGEEAAREELEATRALLDRRAGGG